MSQDKRHRLPARAAAAALLVILLFAVWSPAAQSETEVRYLLRGMKKLVPVSRTRYLLAQAPDSALWGVFTTDGRQLMDYRFAHLSYNACDCFQDSLYEHPLMNRKALVTADGAFVSDYRYGVIRMLSSEWAAGWAVSKGEADAHDYSPDGKEFYNIELCDLFYLGDTPRQVASLSREQFLQAAPHGRYLSVEDRAGNVTVYDPDFRPIGLVVESVKSDVYGVSHYALMDPVTGETVLDGITASREALTAKGLLFLVTREDFSGNAYQGVCDLQGNWLMPPDHYEISTVGADYAVITQNNLKGLYSYALGRVIVPCAYKSIITSTQTEDPYVFYGYACGANGSSWEFISVETGKVTRAITYNKKEMKALGGTLCQSPVQDEYLFMAANGKNWYLQDHSLEVTRGDGRLIVLKQVETGNYGIMTMDGDVALNFWYRSCPVMTDDGKVILETKKNGYELVEILW